MANWTKHWPEVTSENPLQPISPEVLSGVAGSAPLSIKEAALTWYKLLGIRGDAGFEYATRRHVKVTEVSLEPSVDDPQNVSAKMVCELEVTPDMCDSKGVLSHWAMYSLIDEGSAISLLLMKIVQAGENAEQQAIGVSQTMNIFFHHPAPGPGSKIRLVSRSISAQGDMGCCKCEVWDAEKHQLIISGTQLQMMPSAGRRQAQTERANTQNLPSAKVDMSDHDRGGMEEGVNNKRSPIVENRTLQVRSNQAPWSMVVTII